jgi:hypothetical protein
MVGVLRVSRVAVAMMGIVAPLQQRDREMRRKGNENRPERSPACLKTECDFAATEGKKPCTGSRDPASDHNAESVEKTRPGHHVAQGQKTVRQKVSHRDLP